MVHTTSEFQDFLGVLIRSLEIW